LPLAGHRVARGPSYRFVLYFCSRNSPQRIANAIMPFPLTQRQYLARGTGIFKEL